MLPTVDCGIYSSDDPPKRPADSIQLIDMDEVLPVDELSALGFEQDFLGDWYYMI